MLIVAGVVAVVGALITAAGSCWLWLGFKPDNPRYVDDGMLYPGRQTSRVLPNLLKDQQKVTALIAVGGAVQLVATVLVLITALQLQR